MVKKKQNQKYLILTIFLLLLVMITFSATYAFFTYFGEGLTENVIQTGNITFIYEEIEANGAGIGITDAYPMSDFNGKKQTGPGKVFNFKILSNTSSKTSIPYIITARMKNDSTLSQNAVKLYLTEINNTVETELALNNYDKFGLAANIPEGIVERQIHSDIVPAGATDYEKNYRLRMWIDENTDFSQNEDGTYPFNNKTFTVNINVYANSSVVSVGD